MREVLVNRLGGLSLPRKSVVRLTDRPDMTLDVYRGRKQQYNTVCENTCKLSARIFLGMHRTGTLMPCNRQVYSNNEGTSDTPGTSA